MRKRFSVEQMVAVVKQAEAGVPVVEVCRRVGIQEQTFYRWKKKYAGLRSDQVRQLKRLQEENGKLKKLVAELRLAAGRASKKILKPSRHPVMHYLCGAADGAWFEDRDASQFTADSYTIIKYCAKTIEVAIGLERMFYQDLKLAAISRTVC